MKGRTTLCPLLLATTFLLGAAAAVAAPPGAKTMTREGDPLSRLIFNPADLKKKSPPTAFGQMLHKQPVVPFDESKVLPQQGLKEEDKIAKLPGQPRGVDFDQYGGYVTVDQKAGRALFYYFTEAPEPASKPLLLWLNGGPGCSSLGYGAMEELGPFRVKSDGKTLYKNPYAWNRGMLANVLFLESPAGVGFSYSNTTSDYSMSGDTRTAEDSYVFLVNWLERFPEYKSRELYISGESYAGHYVPQLAHTILRHNQFSSHGAINLKGIAIGNAVINDLTDLKGMLDFFWTHALISDDAHRDIKRHCDFTRPEGTRNDKCRMAVGLAEGTVQTEIDIYNIYAPRCFDSNLTAVPKKTSIKNSDPCSDYYVYAYLNDPEVQKALHANVTKRPNPWDHCFDLPRWLDSPDTVLPLLKDFMQNGLRVWVYSGDIDGRVPVTGSRYSVRELNLTVKTPWQAWIAAGEVGGYSEVYQGNITLATVRGAGHMVPSNQALRSLVMIRAFLEGKPLPPYDPFSFNFSKPLP
ncbi:hypothetical protein Taro_027022 [Colocasia esculenta]|uniref:Carboxypeptidase n=1 Tax=Colocasia esculenta TaxID=4460 RepID=A0A843VCX0_COLES|nr:hypothetical protein [Colocasia esculenta]